MKVIKGLGFITIAILVGAGLWGTQAQMITRVKIENPRVTYLQDSRTNLCFASLVVAETRSTMLVPCENLTNVTVEER